MSATIRNNLGIYTIEINGEVKEIHYENVRNLLFEQNFDNHASFFKKNIVVIEEPLRFIDNKYVYENSPEYINR